MREIELSLQQAVKSYDGLPEQGDWIVYNHKNHLITRVDVKEYSSGRFVVAMRVHPEHETTYTDTVGSPEEDVRERAREVVESLPAVESDQE